MKELKRILSYTRRAVDDYAMIEDGDKIAVGVSAGKDSLALLYALAEMRRFYPKKYELIAITVDMGFPNTSFDGQRQVVWFANSRVQRRIFLQQKDFQCRRYRR